ncbi:hypothetical protein JJC03_09180 [Flavobacterium oreochromis]|uniref:hypothetical protein n=1 Tax=Flavobacterium oreochromis TaxID=2906078 RepID=UPI001CE4DB37|nr:hypothetical protein [Flavobacterium oreochromis]QYS85411.1 hypothetical protein JJC03_09180 [Flavobacterium oreochromis]
MVYHECKNGDTGLKNTGAREQCLVGVTVRYMVAIPGFSFANVDELKDLSKINQYVKEKKLYPLYDVNEYAVADKEATFYEGKTYSYETGKAKKVRTFKSVVGSCSYNALSSFNEKEMQAFEFTEDGYIKAVITADKKIKGQTIKLNVGRLQDAVDGTPQSTLVTVNYKDFKEYEQNGANVLIDYSYSDVYGIFDVTLLQVSASATEIKFKVKEGCAGGGTSVTTLTASDIVVRNTAGAIQSVSFVTATSDGVYTLTGTTFTTGYTVSLNNVVASAGNNYEALEKLKVTV